MPGAAAWRWPSRTLARRRGAPMRCRTAWRALSAGSATPLPRHWKSGGPSREAVLTHAPLPPAGVWASPARRRRLAVPPARHRGRDRAAPGPRRRAPTLPRRSIWPARARWSTRCACRSRSSTRAGPRAWMRRRWPSWPTCSRTARWCCGDWLPFDARDWAAQVCRVHDRHAADRRAPRHACAGRPGLRAAGLAAPRHARRPHRAGRHGGHHRHLVRHACMAAAGDRVLAEFPGIGQARCSSEPAGLARHQFQGLP